MSGQVAVAIGFLTRDPSLIWNTALSEANGFITKIISKHLTLNVKKIDGVRAKHVKKSNLFFVVVVMISTHFIWAPFIALTRPELLGRHKSGCC